MIRRPPADDAAQLRRLNRAVQRACDETEPWAARCKASRWAASLAERCGLWRRPGRCEGCGRPGELSRHHDDHARPLVVVYLCPVCHARADGRKEAG